MAEPLRELVVALSLESRPSRIWNDNASEPSAGNLLAAFFRFGRIDTDIFPF